MYKHSILFLIAASLTEARTLVSVIRAFDDGDQVVISCVIARHRDILLEDTKEYLTKQNIPFDVTGTNAPLNAEKILQQYQPDVVVMANDSLIVNRFIIRACDKKNIPTVLIQEAPSAGQFMPVSSAKRPFSWILRNISHGLYLSRAYIANLAFAELFHSTWSVVRRKSIGHRGYGFANVSLFCVFSEYDTEGYLSNGSRAQRIVATGLPGLSVQYQLFQPKFFKKYDFVLFTTCEGQTLMSENDQLEMYHQMVEAIWAVQPDARIGIKYHPLENKNKFEMLISGGVQVIDSLQDSFLNGIVIVCKLFLMGIQPLFTNHETIIGLICS